MYQAKPMWVSLTSLSNTLLHLTTRLLADNLALSAYSISPASGYPRESMPPPPPWGPVLGVGVELPPINGPVVQRLARPSGIRETRGSIPGLAFSFLLPHNKY